MSLLGDTHTETNAPPQLSKMTEAHFTLMTPVLAEKLEKKYTEHPYQSIFPNNLKSLYKVGVIRLTAVYATAASNPNETEGYYKFKCI